MSELNLLIVASIFFCSLHAFFLAIITQENHNFLVVMSCGGNILPRWLRAAKECLLLGGSGLSRNLYYLAIECRQGISITWQLISAKKIY